MRSKRRKDIVLGTASNGQRIILPDQSKKPHLIVSGPSGSGKSRFILSLIIQRIAKGQGCTIIDPHGDLSAYLKAWCSERSHLLDPSKIHFLDADAERHSFGLNVLSVSNRTEIASMASAFSQSMATVFGGRDPNDTPLLTSIFYSLAVALSENGLTLTEASNFLFHAQQDIRATLTAGIENDYLRAFWQNMNATNARQYIETMGSAERRLRAFLANETARRIFGQQDQVIDFTKIMDHGETVILNLANRTGTLPGETRRLLGTLFVSSLVHRAKQRPAHKNPRHHLLVIDECQDFITRDLSIVLDQLRKFGLSVLLSTQSLDFIGDQDARVLKSVIANCSTQVCFGAHDYETARKLAWQLYGDQIDPDKIKEALSKPTVVGYRIRTLKSRSTSQNESSTSSHSRADTHGSSDTRSQSYTESETSTESLSQSATTGEGEAFQVGQAFTPIDEEGFENRQPRIEEAYFSGVTENRSEQASQGQSETSGMSESISQSRAQSFAIGSSYSTSATHGQSLQSGTSHSTGESETLEPILKTLPSATYSLEEQAHKYALTIRRLQSRHAIVKIAQQAPLEVRALNMPDPIVSQRQLGRTICQIKSTTPFLISREDADAEIAARQITLTQTVIAPPNFDAPDDDPFS